MNPQEENLIEDALRSFPLADVPPNLSQKIMGQIRAENTRRIQSPRMPFRLTWMDYALAFFLALIPFTALVIWVTLPRLALLRLTFQWQLIQISGFLPVLSLSLAVTGALLLSAFIFSIHLFLQPEASLRQFSAKA